MAESSTGDTLEWNLSIYDLRAIGHIFKQLKDKSDGLIHYISLKNYLSKKSLLTDEFDCIWSLCDPNCLQKVTCDQFTVIMWLVEQSRKGIKIPVFLSAVDMPEKFASALSVSYHNNSQGAEVINVNILDNASDTLKDEEKLSSDSVNITEKSATKELHFDETPNYKAELNLNQANVSTQPGVLCSSFDIFQEIRNVNEKFKWENMTASVDAKQHIIDELKLFQKKSKEYQHLFDDQEEHILQELMQNIESFRKLIELRKKLSFFNEKYINRMMEIDRDLLELKINKDSFKTKHTFEMSMQQSNTSSNPLASLDATLDKPGLNKSFGSKSTNPFLQDINVQLSIYDTAIETESFTLSTPLLSSSDCYNTIEIPTKFQNSGLDCRSNLSSVSSSERKFSPSLRDDRKCD